MTEIKLDKPLNTELINILVIFPFNSPPHRTPLPQKKIRLSQVKKYLLVTIFEIFSSVNSIYV